MPDKNIDKVSLHVSLQGLVSVANSYMLKGKKLEFYLKKDKGLAR